MATIFYTATSLDGFIADPNNSLEWLFQFGELEPNTFDAFLAGVGAIAMGSTTYQWLYGRFSAEADNPQPWPYPMPTWVFTSRQLSTMANADLRFVDGEIDSVALGGGAPLFSRRVDPPAAIAVGEDLWR